MYRYIALVLVVVTACAQAGDNRDSGEETSPMCSDDWYQSIEDKIPTADAQMHGPDIGSNEWKSAIEFRLGVRNRPDLPSRDSENWCHYIDQLVQQCGLVSGSDGTPVAPQGPSYACDKVSPGSVEANICENDELSALDRKLSGVYIAASRRAVNEHPPRLKAEQRGWIKGRNDCWKSDDRVGCVRDEYLHRIAELQARFRLAPGNGPICYVCDGDSANEVVVTFFQTDPPTLIAERGDSVSLMYRQPSGSGAKYQGRNEMLWEHQDEALITWGYDSKAMRCKKTR